MTTQEKRARQKERRAAIVAAQHAADRRRRMGQIAAVVIGLGILIGGALFAGGGGDDDGGNGAAAGNGGEETTQPGGGGGDDPGGGGDDPVACGAEAPPEANSQQYKEPEQVLKEGVDYGAGMTTSCGVVTVDLLEDEAPETVNNFVFLAQEGFYDGLTFHRVEPNQVIQGGDPNGDGSGGPGYAIEDELPKNTSAYTFGTFAMANSGPNTSGSQFFFNTKDPKGKQSSGYPPAYSLFGEIDINDQKSVDTLVTISSYDTKPQSTTPLETIYIETVEITEN